MKRWLAAIVIFLLLGATISVTVAWMFALVPLDLNNSTEYEHGDRSILVTHNGGIVYYGVADPKSVDLRWQFSGFTIDRTGESLDPPAWVKIEPMKAGELLQYIGTGWPLPALHYGLDFSTDVPLGFLEAHRVHGALRGDHFVREDFEKQGIQLGKTPFLPIAPIWSGLLINTLLYAIAAFVVFNARPIVRRISAFKRLRRNRCAMCDYDRRGHPQSICPECGHTATDRPSLITKPAVLAAVTITVLLLALDTGYAVKFMRSDPFQRIHYAAYNGEINAIKEQLNEGVDVDCPVGTASRYSGTTPLNLAVRAGEPQAVRALIDAGAHVNGADTVAVRVPQTGPPLFLAAWHGEEKIARILIEAGAKVNATDQRGMTPLHWTAVRTRLKMLQALIKHGANPNQTDRTGSTPLHYACRFDDPAVVDTLLQAGANIHAATKSGSTPLALAVDLSNHEVAQLLIDRGAEITFDVMQRPLETNDLDMLKFVGQHGGDVTMRGPNGETLLFHASEYEKNVKVWQYLLDQGIDINATNNNGKTAFDWAMDNNMYDYAEFLEKHGARRQSDQSDKNHSQQ